jgi:arylsulfatase A-like enzyme
MYLAPLGPHWPATPAPRHAALYPDLQAPRPPAYNEVDVSDKPAYVRRLPRITGSLDDVFRKRVQSLQAVDDMVAGIVGELDRQGILEDTFIFFTSDNGFLLGEHRIGDPAGRMVPKRVPYQESTRVSLIVRGPGVPAGVTRQHLTANTDIAPTVAELAGTQTPPFVDGRSLVPLLGAEPPALDDWRRAVLLEYFPASVDQRSALNVPRFAGIRTQHYAYTEYATGERELYDLRRDPNELENIASEASASTLQRLARVVARLKNCRGDGCVRAENAKVPLLSTPR